MTEPISANRVISFLTSALIGALENEVALRKTARSTCILFSGKRIRASNYHYYYRFEIPEGLLLDGVREITCIFGEAPPVSLTAQVVSLECQYLTLCLNVEIGEIIPEVRILWTPAFLSEMTLEVIHYRNTGATITISPASISPAPAFKTANPALAMLSDQQRDALHAIQERPVTLLWGPQSSGKSFTCAAAAVAAIADGKRVLYLHTIPAQIDSWLESLLSAGREMKVDVAGKLLRVGPPTQEHADTLIPFSSTMRINQTAGKDSPDSRRRELLITYYTGKIREALGEEHTKRLADLRHRVEEKNGQIASVTEELKAIQAQIDTIQNASMLERVKKGYSKEVLAQAQKGLEEKTAAQKRLQSLQSALSTEILRMELHAPLNEREKRKFHEALSELDKNGGPEQTLQTLNDDRKSTFASILREKPCVAATLSDAMALAASGNVRFDLVIIDDAHLINLAEIAALAGYAVERLVIAGDPLQSGPTSAAHTDLAMRWLQQEIFEFAGEVSTVYQFFDWARQKPAESVFLGVQRTFNLKLSRFSASTIFNDNFQTTENDGAVGKIYFIDTSEIHSQSKQYIGRKKILPFNETQTRKTLEMVKHALMEPGRSANDVGVVLPISGPTMYLKRELRANGMENVLVGLPHEFAGLRKQAIIFDTTVAGIDYTMKALDDKKIGAHAVLRLLQTIISLTIADLYIIADLSHIRAVYKQRIFLDVMNALQQTGQLPLIPAQTAKKFDDLSLTERLDKFDISDLALQARAPRREPDHRTVLDPETELRMRLTAKQSQGSKQAGGVKNHPRETLLHVLRILSELSDLNLLSLFLGGGLLFRRTQEAEAAARELLERASHSEKDFREIMEAWNVVIYEMSGGNKSDLSFFTKQAPETRVRWDINNLKMYYSSDMEAVIEEGKHQVAVAVAKIFQECVGKPQPVNPADWSHAYLNFLGKMELYLDWISQQVRE